MWVITAKEQTEQDDMVSPAGFLWFCWKTENLAIIFIMIKTKIVDFFFV